MFVFTIAVIGIATWACVKLGADPKDAMRLLKGLGLFVLALPLVYAVMYGFFMLWVRFYAVKVVCYFIVTIGGFVAVFVVLRIVSLLMKS